LRRTPRARAIEGHVATSGSGRQPVSSSCPGQQNRGLPELLTVSARRAMARCWAPPGKPWAPWGCPIPQAQNVGGQLRFLSRRRAVAWFFRPAPRTNLWQRPRDDRFSLGAPRHDCSRLVRPTTVMARPDVPQPALNGQGLHRALNDFYFRPLPGGSCHPPAVWSWRSMERWRPVPGGWPIISTPTAPLLFDGGRVDRSCNPGIDAIVVIRSVPMSLFPAAPWGPPRFDLVVYAPWVRPSRPVKLWKEPASTPTCWNLPKPLLVATSVSNSA